MRDPYKIINHGKEALALAFELQKQIATPLPTMLNKYGWVYKTKDGELEIANRGNQACYADLSDNWKPAGAKVLYFVDWANSGYKPSETLSRENAETFVKWAATQSVWRNAFVIKDPKKLISSPAIFHTAHPLRFVVQAAMLLRYVYEKQDIVAMWHKLKKHVDSHSAFYLAHFIGEYYRDKTLYVSRNTAGHSMFDSNECDQPIVLHSLSTRNYSYMTGMLPTYEKAWGYKTLDWIWAPKKWKSLEFPETTDAAGGNTWAGATKGWRDLGSLAKDVVKINMDIAIKRMDANYSPPQEAVNLADLYAPDAVDDPAPDEDDYYEDEED